LAGQSNSRVPATIGDGSTDAPSSIGAISPRCACAIRTR
jgi:hypothetical protein